MMNQEDIFKKIGQILNELNEQYQYLAQNPRELSELELELFMANASFLSDHVQIARKLNNQAIQKALPEHTEDHHEKVVYEPVVKLTEVFDEPAKPVIAQVPAAKPVLDEEIFKLDNETSSFEFILNERPSSDKFEFEEKSIDEIFDRPLSKEEEQIIAQKQKLREMDSLGISSLPEEEEEEGPEPFLVTTKTVEPEPVEEPAPIKEEEFIAAAAVKIAEEEEQEAEPEEITEESLLKIEEPLQTPEPIRFEAFVRQEEPVKQEEYIRPEPKQEEPEAEPIVQKELFTPIAERVVPPALAQPIVKPTLNDILSGNSVARNLNTENGRATITDLKQAISLNDKMRYIKDLFNGYNLAYAEAIDLLNKMPDFKTADTFLQNNYAIKHNWAAKQETAEQFYELLNQRFPAAK